jgi:hypothetical protein
MPLGDGDEKDEPPNLCVDVRKGLPACMELIHAADVSRAIQRYLDGGVGRSLTPAQRHHVQPFLRDSPFAGIDSGIQTDRSVM